MSRRVGRRAAWAALCGATVALAPAMAVADGALLERGREVFRRCEACHSLVPGEHRFGPSLAGLLGRRAGRVRGYDASAELRASGLRWDRATLRAFLSRRAAETVPGTRMAFDGVADPADVEALIELLAAASR